MSRFAVILLCAAMTATVAPAQSDADSLTDAQVVELIDQVKRMPVSRLDSTLPQVSFAKWLQTVVTPETKVSWVLRYASGDGAAASGSAPHFPTCVETNALLEDGWAVSIQVAIGTPGRAGNIRPFVFRADLWKQHESISLDHLRDLPAALKKALEMADHSEDAR